MTRFVFFIFSFLALVPLWGQGQVKFKVPPLSGPVIDEVGLLSPAQTMRLERGLKDFNLSGKAQVQIYITNSLQEMTIEQASISIVEQWKLGDAKKDNGLLFLISPNDRKMRFEIGQGLEGVIPDVVSKRIQTQIVIPYFRNKQMAEGILAGTAKILEIIDQDFMQSHPEMAQDLENEVPTSRTHKKNNLPVLIFFVAFLIITILNRFGGGGGGRGFRGGYYGGGGFGGGGFGSSGGGGSWSGGGGGFSGGGSSSNW